MKIQVKKLVDKALESLTDQQRRVLVLRYGLDGKGKRTLQEIADEYSLTRERIRQVQNTAIAALGKDECAGLLASTITHLEDALRKCGGATSADILCASCEFATKAEQNYIHLLLMVGNSFSLSRATDAVDQYWYVDEQHKRAIDATLDRVHQDVEGRGEALLSDEDMRNLFENLGAEHKDHLPTYGDAMLLSLKVKRNPLGEWGLATHPEVALNGLAGYIRLVLRDSGEPLHFNRIADRITELRGKSCHRGSCHNELVRRDEFILVGRGLYALDSMGYRPGTIADIIAAGIKERGPMTQKEIIEYVSRERHVKTQSIVLTLGKKGMFTRDDRSRYCLAM
ncbi:MAG: hypothetical protein OXB96_01000 [Candidatus Kaiserbacteria bacterium]|nr:hypothetical protein [Candidatus Kaiserbacteria bacterium]